MKMLDKIINHPKRDDVKIKLEDGTIEQFSDIFKHQAKTAIAVVLGKGKTSMDRCINNPGRLTLEDIFELADYWEVKNELLYKLILKQVEKKAVQKNKEQPSEK